MHSVGFYSPLKYLKVVLASLMTIKDQVTKLSYIEDDNDSALNQIATSIQGREANSRNSIFFIFLL